MSRAFVKETEGDTDGLPDRPISPHRNLVTEAGLAAIDAALERFEMEHRTAADKRRPRGGCGGFARSAVLAGAARQRGGRETFG